MTIAEFALMPDAPGKQELLEGEPILLPPNRFSQMTIIHAVFESLRTVIETSRIYVEAGYQMSSDTWLQPDVSVTWPDQPVHEDYLQSAPMIAIEVVSPDHTADEVDRKTAAYLRHGAAEVWIIYPRTKCMIVHKNEGIVRITGSYRSDSVPAVVNVSELLRNVNGYNK